MSGGDPPRALASDGPSKDRSLSTIKGAAWRANAGSSEEVAWFETICAEVMRFDLRFTGLVHLPPSGMMDRRRIS
jgi:hypothetical protein